MNKISEASKQIEGQIIEWRRELHRIPEVSHDLPKTADYIFRELQSLGVESIIKNVGILRNGAKSCGIIADITGTSNGKTLAIRADMDALPIREEVLSPFASVNGNMHACGHDAHMAMLLGVVKLIAERRSELKGKVRFIFQPAEETINGAVPMLLDGALYGVDAIIGLHTGTLWNEGKPGAIGFRTGALMASTDRFIAQFKGKGGHGAMPHLTVDPVLMACQSVCQLQSIISREVSPLSPAVITVGMINGGAAFNIIPDIVRIEGTLRTLDPELRKRLLLRITETIEGVARSMRGSAEVTVIPGCGVVQNDDEVVLKMVNIAKQALGDDMAHVISEPTMGGEDFSAFLDKVEGAYFFHNATFGDGRDMPHHNPKFQLNELTLWSGTAAMTAFALYWQEDIW
ncbi:MAG: M20 family metallopeptidase [Synergistaceae bacterium]|nr:M20 family metallopeptidase [Synergistaceae bacterium]